MCINARTLALNEKVFVDKQNEVNTLNHLSVNHQVIQWIQNHTKLDFQTMKRIPFHDLKSE